MAKKSKRSVQKDQTDALKRYLEGLAKEDPTAKTRSAVIGNALKEKQMTIPEAARRSGISAYLFSSFMTGRTNLNQEQLQRVVNTLGVAQEEIMTKIPLNASPIDRSREKMRNRQKELIEGAKNISEEQKQIDTEKITPIGVEAAKGTETKKQNDNKNTEERSIPEKEETDKKETVWEPNDEEISALMTLCTKAGKAKVYHAIWEILQDPVCRKGGVAS